MTARKKRVEQLAYITLVMAQKLKYMRESAHLNQAEFASLLDVCPSTVGCWEHGEKAPNLLSLYILFKNPQFRGYLTWFFDDREILPQNE